MAQTFTARATAQTVNAELRRRGVTLARPIDAKRVRAWVRDNVDAYDDDGYTSHAYDARLRDRIVAAFVAKHAPSKSPKRGTTARAKSASRGRNAESAPPADRKRRSVPPVPPMSGDATTDAEQTA